MTDPVDAQFVEEPVTGGEIVPAREPSGVLMPLEATQVIEAMHAYQALIPQLLDDSDYQSAGRGKRFVKKSGWLKIGRAFNLSVELVPGTLLVERDGSGNPLNAAAIARAIAPNGQAQDGDGYCSAEEERFQNEKGRARLENDMRTTATTRAKKRAIADLVGKGDDDADAPAGGGNPYGVPWTGDTAEPSQALLKLAGGDIDTARVAWVEIKRAHGGQLPAAAANALITVASLMPALKSDPQVEGEPEPSRWFDEPPPGVGVPAPEGLT